MSIRTASLSAFAALSLAACGVDTTGLSADSSRRPMGSPSASVVVAEFADLQCPACKAAHETVTKPLIAKYGSRIRFEFKHFPLQGIHAYALPAAEAAECAADQGKFWEFVDLTYINQDKLGTEAIKEWAATLKLDQDLFARCTASRIKKDTVLADYKEGEKLGVNSTPSFFLNGERIMLQAIGDLDAAVAAALAKTDAAPL